jgi:CRP-like cAMP-binding protein
MLNRLVGAMSKSDQDLLKSHFEPIELQRGQVLETPGEKVDAAFFLDSGLVSVIAQSPQRQIAVAVVGHDGMTGLDIILDSGRSANETVVQAAGSAWRIAADDLRRAQQASPTLRAVLLRYIHVFMVQASQTALTNGHAGMDERLARWILMSHDRFQGDDLTVTHEFIALMLGVRRQGVTESLHTLEGKHLIRSTRDHVRVLDRGGLIDLASGSYGVCEAEYERLIGEYRRHRPRATIAPTP